MLLPLSGEAPVFQRVYAGQIIQCLRSLSPAYDLAPSGGFNGNHSTTIAGQGQPSRANLFEAGEQAGLKQNRMLQIFEEVYDTCEAIRLDNW